MSGCREASVRGERRRGRGVSALEIPMHCTYCTITGRKSPPCKSTFDKLS